MTKVNISMASTFLQNKRISAMREIEEITAKFTRLKSEAEARWGLTTLFLESRKQYADVLLALRKYLSPLKGKMILEIGCGIGIFLPVIKKEGAIAYGVDISEVAVSIAREIGINVLCADARNLTKYFEVEKFDAIISKAFLEKFVLGRFGNYETTLNKILEQCNVLTKYGGINIHQAVELDIHERNLSKFGFELLENYTTDFGRIAILKKVQHAHMLGVQSELAIGSN